MAKARPCWIQSSATQAAKSAGSTKTSMSESTAFGAIVTRDGSSVWSVFHVMSRRPVMAMPPRR
jgi:hypothetical protein